MRELFLDCSTGAAGDMLAAALLELYSDRDEIINRLNGIGIPGVEFSAETVFKHSVAGTHLKVSYLGCEEEEQGACEVKHHRGINDIHGIIDTLNLPEKVRNDVKSVYEIIARAESKVHGCEMKDIHFHELGTMDAVADISAVCYMIYDLGAEHITASKMCTGFGEIKCAHGVLPVPAPAAAQILIGIPCFAGEIEGEMCTPTGAALIKYYADAFGEQPDMTVHAVGMGMGKKSFPKLSAVRAVLGESSESIIELSCNVDDMSPEAIGFAIDELLRNGAPDAYYVPIGMKKNRPGVILTCLCRESRRDEMVRLIFKHTSTIGIRETLCRRYILKRREETVVTPYGSVRVKISEGYGTERIKAEYEDLAKIARAQDMSIEEISNEVKALMQK